MGKALRLNLLDQITRQLAGKRNQTGSLIQLALLALINTATCAGTETVGNTTGGDFAVDFAPRFFSRSVLVMLMGCFP